MSGAPLLINDPGDSLAGTGTSASGSPATLSEVDIKVSGDVLFYDSVDGSDVNSSTPPLLVVSRFCVPAGSPITPSKSFTKGIYCVATIGASVQITLS